MKNTHVVIRSKSAGVFFGILRSHDKKTMTATLSNARRVWYWSGAASLSELAMAGTSNPNECKFPQAVDSITVAEVIEVIQMTTTAVKSLQSVAVWRAAK